MRLRDPNVGDLAWIVHRQAQLYHDEFGWNAEFETLALEIIADYAKSRDPAHDQAWIAEIDGKIVGSTFLVRGDEPHVGKLRMLYVDPIARGKGVGAAMVEACVARARSVGDTSLILWTNSVLVAARRIYERAGFKLIDEAPHHSFGKDLIGQTFQLHL